MSIDRSLEEWSSSGGVSFLRLHSARKQHRGYSINISTSYGAKNPILLKRRTLRLSPFILIGACDRSGFDPRNAGCEVGAHPRGNFQSTHQHGHLYSLKETRNSQRKPTGKWGQSPRAQDRTCSPIKPPRVTSITSSVSPKSCKTLLMNRCVQSSHVVISSGRDRNHHKPLLTIRIHYVSRINHY